MSDPPHEGQASSRVLTSCVQEGHFSMGVWAVGRRPKQTGGETRPGLADPNKRPAPVVISN
jgi:hypothetical protein